ncbi:hypothetical protein COV40_01115 [Candidatus Berkelbacteria bacterium CG11_big_fil_rev_8_21_14_0_20_42_15]|uniref:Regulatory protein RecX n=1 Tax=Candidatus Berkelbacteria bacterium CG11_big_fil_rev_8_21_14_0_20_42_15 TaxID=1974517 RepID=A0A2H0PZB8_9BACT|nr:MAG: hypothetical protein COV40_01115 [Candidatus Berkelbacteria bacterium CG11_big_fil_rev_8_21_14_0_20_42_15]
MKKLKPLEYAFFLLKLRDRSIGELEGKMEHKEYSPQEISETVAFLIEKDFLDDERFARNFVRFKKSLKPTGKYYLRSKLIEKKVPNEIIEKTLSESLDEPSEIEELADSWLSHHKNIPREKLYEKLSRHLLSRGFEWEKVREVVAEKM